MTKTISPELEAQLQELSQARWHRRPEERRPEILAAAKALFAEVGYARTTIADVAKKAGVSAATVSHYFGTKAGLFEAMVSDCACAMAMDDLGLLVVTGGYRAALHRLVDDEWKRMNAPGAAGLMLVVLGEKEEFPLSAQQLFRQISERQRRRMTHILEAGKASGEFDVADPAIMSHVIGALLLGATIDLNCVSECVVESACREEAYAALLAAVDRLVGPVAPATT